MASPEIERWDDEDFGDLDDVQFRAASTTTSQSHTRSAHRDSISSRLSLRSESNQGDENWDVLVDETAPVKDAVAIAKSKGIPIPANVPRSALEGGTIRRLKGKEIKKAIAADDWTEDLDFGPSGPLQLAKPDVGKRLPTADFPDLALPSESRKELDVPGFNKDSELPTNISAQQGLPALERLPNVDVKMHMMRATSSEVPRQPTNLPTVKCKTSDSGRKTTVITNLRDGNYLFGEEKMPVTVKKESQGGYQVRGPKSVLNEARISCDYEFDIEVPPGADHLVLASHKQIPRTPQQNDDFDLEWAEGSLGTRNGGSKREVRSNRSSSISALSPSVSSAFTAESEDDGLDGLILPEGPLKLDEALKNRRQISVPAEKKDIVNQQLNDQANKRDDFFNDIDLGDGNVFDSAKLTLNRNIKHSVPRPASPSKRQTTTLNFTTTKTQTTISRLPRFPTTHDRHDRVKPKLEPVSESGAPVSRYRRPESRLGHSTQSSISAIPSPLTPTQPSTPSRRTLRNAESRADMRADPPTTTSAQLLKAKRSMPMMRNLNSPTKGPLFPRPPSRQEDNAPISRIPARPKTPTERAESRLGAVRKIPAPFLPAGASTAQSHHVSIKPPATRHYRRQDSDGSNESTRPLSRAASRPDGMRRRGSLTTAELVAASKKPITKPTRRRNFGDGTELEIFDDLPTSATTESKFIKQPIGRGAPKTLRNKLGQSLLTPSSTSLASSRPGTETPVPQTPVTPMKQEFKAGFPNSNVPRFARDTAASRLSREQRQISIIQHQSPVAFQNMRGEPLQPLSNNWKTNPLHGANTNWNLNPLQSPHSNWKAKLSRPPMHSPNIRKRGERNTQQKPHLIKPMGEDVHRVKTEKGMQYNPVLFRWEGNENALAPFDVPDFHPRGQSPSGSPNSKPPALITNMNVGMAGGVQVVGGMVFDPRRMCWLKMAEDQQTTIGLKGVGSVQLEEEEDVFAGLEDLKEEDERSIGVRSGHIRPEDKMRAASGESAAETGHSGDEYGLGEEFDVGPDFIRRQRAEEDKWKKKVEKWLRRSDDEGLPADGRGGWRWDIRDLVMAEP